MVLLQYRVRSLTVLRDPLDRIGSEFFFSRDKQPMRDLLAALSISLLAVPQGIAYAMVAGLPPKMGLIAATFPTIIGSLFRSSRHVITGPTNAISLLVGSALLVQTQIDPTQLAISLRCWWPSCTSAQACSASRPWSTTSRAPSCSAMSPARAS